MKLSELKEARYSGDHPVIELVAAQLAKPATKDVVKWNIDERDVDGIRTSFNSKYGEATPLDLTGKMCYWVVQPGDHVQSETGHDRTIILGTDFATKEPVIGVI